LIDSVRTSFSLPWSTNEILMDSLTMNCGDCYIFTNSSIIMGEITSL